MLGGWGENALKVPENSHLKGALAVGEVNVLKGRKTRTRCFWHRSRGSEVKEQILAAEREGVSFRVAGPLDCVLGLACRSARAQCVCVYLPEPAQKSLLPIQTAQ